MGYTIPDLPKHMCKHAMVITNDKELMVIGGFQEREDGFYCASRKNCYILKNGKWILHSSYQKYRMFITAITMPNGIYIFGGNTDGYGNICEFLPNGSQKWQFGPEIPNCEKFNGEGVAISPTELVLIGGLGNEKRVMKFNIITNTFCDIGQLKIGRWNHRCAVFDNKIFVCGGLTMEVSPNDHRSSCTKHLKATEVISLTNGFSSEILADFNLTRVAFGLGVLRQNGVENLVAFGGSCKKSRNQYSSHDDSIEMWNRQKRKWEMTSWKLSEPKWFFGYCFEPKLLDSSK